MFVAKAHNPPRAALLIVAASAFIASTTLLAKALGTDVLGPALHPMQISHGRFLFALLVIISTAGILRPRLSRPNWGLHIGRTSFGWLGVTLMFASVAFIPIADATAISFLNPVFAMVLAIPLLKEGVGPWRWLAAAVALTGALVLLRPTPASFQPAGLLALTAAAVIGIELIFIKKLAAREIPIQILLINNAMGLVIASVAVSFVFRMPSLEQWAALIGIGVLMACAQACFVNGMACADASFVAPISYATLIFAAFYDFAVFGVIPDGVSMIGSAIILTGGLILVWREARLRQT